MRVLVTGSSGFIGAHVVTELKRRGHVPLPFDRPGYDVRDSADVDWAMRGGTRPDLSAEAVINLAGVLGTAELIGDELRAVQSNIAGAVNVYDLARDHGIPVVQIGTGHKGQPNPYAITKACAEDLGLARAQWRAERIVVVRAFHVYGPGQKPPPPWGDSPVRKFFPTFACAALSGERLQLYGGGDQVIDPVHVEDVAQVLVDALHGPFGIVREAGCGKDVTVRQVARDILRLAGVQARVPDIAEPRLGEPPGARVVAADPMCRTPWPSRARETLNWYRAWLADRAAR